MKNNELISELLLNLFRTLLYWSGYCLLLLILLEYGQSLFFMMEMYDVFATISYLLPNIVLSLIIAIFIMSFQNVRVLKKYKEQN